MYGEIRPYDATNAFWNVWLQVKGPEKTLEERRSSLDAEIDSLTSILADLESSSPYKPRSTQVWTWLGIFRDGWVDVERVAGFYALSNPTSFALILFSHVNAAINSIVIFRNTYNSYHFCACDHPNYSNYNFPLSKCLFEFNSCSRISYKHNIIVLYDWRLESFSVSNQDSSGAKQLVASLTKCFEIRTNRVLTYIL